MEESQNSNRSNQTQTATDQASQTPDPTSSDNSVIKIIVGSAAVLLGFIQILVQISLAVFVLPQLYGLYKNLAIKLPFTTYLAYPLVIVFSIIGLINIFLGIKSFRNSKYVSKAAIFLAVSFILEMFLAGGTVISVINPIYTLIGQIDNNQEAISPVPSLNPTINPDSTTANWKTYNSKVRPTNMTDDKIKELSLPDSYASFKYPTTWDAKETGDGTYNSITLTSKNGTEISYSSGGNFHGGACSSNPVTIYNVYPLDNRVSLVDYKDSYSSEERLYVVDGTFTAGEVSDCKFDPVLDITGLQIAFGANKLAQADKQEAIKILSTFKFSGSNTPSASGDFPIYSSAVFVENFPHTPDCETSSKMVGDICNYDYQIYNAYDSLANIGKWYSTTRNGWKCNTDIINYKTADNLLTCSNGKVEYALVLHINDMQSVKISIGIPVKK